MNTKLADKIIAQGKPVTVHNARFQETFTALFVSRDRYSIYTSDGRVFDRGELELVTDALDTRVKTTKIRTGYYLAHVQGQTYEIEKGDPEWTNESGWFVRDLSGIDSELFGPFQTMKYAVNFLENLSTVENPQLENPEGKTMSTYHSVVGKIVSVTGRVEVISSTDTTLSNVGESFSSTLLAGKELDSTWLLELHLTPKGSKKVDSVKRHDISMTACDFDKTAETSVSTVESSATVIDVHSTVETTKDVQSMPVVNRTLESVDFSVWGNKEFFVSEDARQRFETAYRMLVKNPNKPVKMALSGDSGYGKTTLVENFADFVGLDFLRVNCASMRDVTSWFGEMVVEEKNGASIMQYVPSEFADYMTRGNCVICLDEFNRVQSDLHNSLFPLFDDSAKTTVYKMPFKVGPNVIFVATVNIGYQYGATFEIDMAMFNRFEIMHEVLPLPYNVETSLIMNRVPDIALEDVETIVRIATAIRDNELTTCSTRSTLSIARLVAHGMSIVQAFNTSLVLRIPNDESGRIMRKSIVDCVQSLLVTSA